MDICAYKLNSSYVLCRLVLLVAEATPFGSYYDCWKLALYAGANSQDAL